MRPKGGEKGFQNPSEKRLEKQGRRSFRIQAVKNRVLGKGDHGNQEGDGEEEGAGQGNRGKGLGLFLAKGISGQKEEGKRGEEGSEDGKIGFVVCIRHAHPKTTENRVKEDSQGQKDIGNKPDPAPPLEAFHRSEDIASNI